jgi:hypothetical protein
VLWLNRRTANIGKEADMSIAGKNVSGKSSPLIELAQELGEFVQEAAKNGIALRDLERGTFDRLLKMGFTVVEQFLSLQGDGDLGETVSLDDGQLVYRSAEPHSRPVRTIFGLNQFLAYVYRKRPHPNTPIVFRPIDARMSLSPARWSHLLEEFTQLFAIEQAFDPAAKAFAQIFRQQLSVDTLESVNQQMGDEAGEFLLNLTPPTREEEGELLVLTCDGKGVPMVKVDADRLRCFEERPQRPGNRRMATLAGVYSVDKLVRTPEQILEALFREEHEELVADTPRPEPCHKRVIACLPRIVEEVDPEKPVTGSILALSWAADEVRQRRRPNQTLLCLADGQSSLWSQIELCVEIPATEIVEILDIIHVVTYVWRAAKVFFHRQELQESFVRERMLRILKGEVASVITGLRRMTTLQGIGAAGQKEIETICGYFTTNAHRMQYDKYLAAGYPIATGVIEGACRHLVKDRMERSGMRWTVTGAQAMLNLRAVEQASYWDDFQQSRLASQNESLKPYRSLIESITPLAG